ncbi:MAG: TonB-dependent receptor [Niabella sp.]
MLLKRVQTKPRYYLITFILLVCSFINAHTAYAQQKTYTGTVIDEQGHFIQGATVMIKNKSAGTSTDNAGKFSIRAASGETLVVTAVGKVPYEIVLGSKTELAVLLKTTDDTLDDVVVIGYGTRSRHDVAGAVVTVDERLLQDRPVSNTLEALQGAAPGLVVTRTNGQPGAEGWTARIRGITSLDANNSPLVIIDGVEGELETINPNDIQSISVLEDAASASIYGAKAGGGVILVTTRSGKENQKPRMNVSSLYVTRKPYARPEILSSADQARLQNIAQFNTNGRTPFSDQQIKWLEDPDTNYVWNNSSKTWDYYYDNNMVDILMRKSSPQRSVDFSISGGGDKSTYRFSLGYLDQQGVFKFGPDKFSRFNARMNYTTKFSKMLSFDSRLSFAKTNILQPSEGVTGTGLLYNTYSIKASANPIFTPGSNDQLYAFLGTISTAYPILKDGGYNNEDGYEMNGVFSLSAKRVLKGLDLKLVYSPSITLTDQVLYKRTIERYSIDEHMNPVPGTPINQQNSLQKARPYTIKQNFQALADYKYKVNRHNFHLLGGYEFKSYQYDLVQATQAALLLNDFPTLNYTTLSAADVSNVRDNIQINTWLSYFSRLTYNYANKYYFEGSIRNDGSSRLAPGYKFSTFYAGNVFWRMTQENWFKKALPFLNEFKLSASYGTAGGAQTGSNRSHNYDFQALLSNGFYPFNDARTAYLYQAALPAESKGWEVIKMANFGIETELLKSRLSASFNYFIKTNDNVFARPQLPTILGVTPNSLNLAAIRVQGWGLKINWRDQFKNGGYFVTVNLSDDKNKVVRYDGDFAYQADINPNLPGYSTNAIFGYLANGYFNSQEELDGAPILVPNTDVGHIKYVDINNDGKINAGINTAEDHGDLVYLGNTNPRYVYGFNGGVNWKGFDLSFLFTGVGKRTILLEPNGIIPFYQSWRMPWAIHQDYWTPENTDARFPKLRIQDRINTATSTHWLQNATYLRLKNLQVGYTLTKKRHKIKAIDDVRIYFSGQDLWEKTGMWFKYFDPENDDKAGYNYPLWRSYSIGLNFSF